ncbi:YfcE family phosphodiesterase [[Mycoplasma] testudinis]|uniref:YfcE family phosphodiesterase n=1 Tax=[Mycoplasma] testudinis TaxID=33924 RepID=UPI0004875B54|nr:metallophosphoesterase [[Mycoplasma] testudinis]
MTKVLSVSDTHGMNERWKQIIEIEKPDIVLHSGDHCTKKTIMIDNATYWVAGNNDYIGNEIETFTIENLKFVLLHGHQCGSRWDNARWKENLVEFVKPYSPHVMVYGHSHIQDYDVIDNVITINPGSLQLPRNKENLPTYATFNVDQDQLTNFKIHFVTY